MFYMTMQFYPDSDSGIIAATNQGDAAARDAVFALRDELLTEYSIP
jgi:hypothetical protein